MSRKNKQMMKKIVDKIIVLEEYTKFIPGLFHALDNVIWYNDLYDSLVNIKNDLVSNKNVRSCKYYRININDDKLIYAHEGFGDEQFEVIWMILVSLFGNYGTSPRTGWLEVNKKDEIIAFIDIISQTSREAENHENLI